MTARMVEWLGRSLLHERTIALIVEPALADLSFESDANPSRWRVHTSLGPWVAFGLAMWHDIAWDPRGPAWGRSARVLGSLALVVASYHLSMLTLMLGFESKIRAGFSHQLAAVSGQTALLLMALAFAFGVVWAARRAHGADGPP